MIGTASPRSLIVVLLALLAFHRLDGHIVWVSTQNLNSVQGAGQLGYPTGTILSVGSDHVTVKENVNEVVRAIRAAEEKK